jgi:cysteine desulfurase
MKKIYLDYAAATPVDPAVVRAMLPYLSNDFYNPSALYLSAHKVAKDVNEARAKIASWLGARPSEIIFTAGGTESDNLAIHGVMRQFPNGNVVVSAIEHEAVLEPAKLYDARIAPVLPDGRLDLNKLEKLIDDKTVLISVMYANNEIGTIEPIREISKIIQKKRIGRRMPLYLHTDACQAAAYMDLHVSRLGVDLMTINAGKIYGPKQVGALYVSPKVKLASQILGGGQERSYRSGTENVAGIIGFAAALDLVQTRRQTEYARLEGLQKLAFGLIQEKIPNAIINGSQKTRLPNNVHITIPGQDNERLIMAMDEKGIMLAAGSACSASDEEPSHVCRAIGLTDQEARASLRITMGSGTTETDILKTIETLAQLLS